MSDNENSQLGSDSTNLNEYDEWAARVVQQNRQLDDIVTELLISMPNMIIGDHPPRARRRYRDRQREQGETRLMEEYFVDNPTYDEVIFRRRFRMRKPLFLRILSSVTANDRYFQQRRDATGRQGLSPLQKCTGAMRVLAYGTSADAQDEYLRMSETVTRDALKNFVEGVISCFGEEYLRRPNQDDLARLLYVGEERGFPGMIGSIDCMHWEWKNCPTAWAGQYAGRSGKTTIILEAVASYDLWIWHAFFGTPGSCNDINVLHRSPIFSDVLAGRAPNVSYVVNGRESNMTYYLTDGIYPSWAAFVKSITAPQIRKHKLFAERQEAARKDVERAFGVLQARFAFLRRPCLLWDKDIMGKIMIACIILHNMIVEDERDTYLHYYDPSEFLNDIPINQQRSNSTQDYEQTFEYSTERIASLSSYMTNREQLRNREAHITLKNDLIEHIWQKFGSHE
ncbi:hypothetical protein L2E82_07462 [Cichorium intybus]|uniref:Uncharacterized protein n=1 Tax=Cichorium intybus TaxID=13427 RepID=A0ACB9G4Y9_CICIN|nr:hypothetical protein L2E82_07462 [Cichorium intybus]